MPPWQSAPAGELGVTLALDAVIGESESGVVRVPYVQVFSEGMFVGLERLADPHKPPFASFQPRGRRDPDRFLFGIRYADGREVDTAHVGSPSTRPPRGALVIGSGSGGGLPNRERFEHWLWPLPPPGLMWFRCRWPEAGIAESEAEIDTRQFLDAANRTRRYWSQDDLPRLPGSQG